MRAGGCERDSMSLWSAITDDHTEEVVKLLLRPKAGASAESQAAARRHHSR